MEFLEAIFNAAGFCLYTVQQPALLIEILDSNAVEMKPSSLQNWSFCSIEILRHSDTPNSFSHRLFWCSRKSLNWPFITQEMFIKGEAVSLSLVIFFTCALTPSSGSSSKNCTCFKQVQIILESKDYFRNLTLFIFLHFLNFPHFLTGKVHFHSIF